MSQKKLKPKGNANYQKLVRMAKAQSEHLKRGKRTKFLHKITDKINSGINAIEPNIKVRHGEPCIDLILD